MNAMTALSIILLSLIIISAVLRIEGADIAGKSGGASVFGNRWNA